MRWDPSSSVSECSASVCSSSVSSIPSEIGGSVVVNNNNNDNDDDHDVIVVTDTDDDDDDDDENDAEGEVRRTDKTTKSNATNKNEFEKIRTVDDGSGRG